MNKKTLLALAVSPLLAGFAVSSYALSTTTTFAASSSVAGAYTIDFGTSLIDNNSPLSTALPSGTAGGVTYSYSGGALFNFNSSSSLPNGISARPPGSTGNFYSVGTSPAAQNGPGVVTFSQGLSYFGFLWGSPDAYNVLTVYDGANVIGTFDGSAVLVPPNGDQSYSAYFNLFAGPGQVITSVSFASNTNAFETDNHAFIAAVPEPETYAMLLAGLGLMGAVMRRRKAGAAA